jgi:hypothetical protein
MFFRVVHTSHHVILNRLYLLGSKQKMKKLDTAQAKGASIEDQLMENIEEIKNSQLKI